MTIYTGSFTLVNMPTSTRTAAVTAAAAPTATTATTAIALLRTHSLATLAHKELERMILAGDLPAGGKLNEAEVASLLGISRGPVREAFRALEESGLVRVEKNRGVFVRQISMAEADRGRWQGAGYCWRTSIDSKARTSGRSAAGGGRENGDRSGSSRSDVGGGNLGS